MSPGRKEWVCQINVLYDVDEQGDTVEKHLI
jgi:hypothetical protein